MIDFYLLGVPVPVLELFWLTTRIPSSHAPIEVSSWTVMTTTPCRIYLVLCLISPPVQNDQDCYPYHLSTWCQESIIKCVGVVCSRARHAPTALGPTPAVLRTRPALIPPLRAGGPHLSSLASTFWFLYSIFWTHGSFRNSFPSFWTHECAHGLFRRFVEADLHLRYGKAFKCSTGF